MAALRLMRRWGVPLATAAGAPLLVPVVRAEEPPPATRMVRPSDLPIYEEPEEVLDFEYHGRERTSLEEGVGVVRQQVEGVVEVTRSTRERVVHVYETGKAHSMATVDYVTDEENMLSRAGAITVGGLAGLVLGARRRGGFFRKLIYTSSGVITAASLCYPRQAYAVSQEVYCAAKNYGAIGYNFVVGVKPQSKAPPPPPPPPPSTEQPKEAEKEAPAAADDTPQPPTPVPESPGAEVSSAVTLSLPPGKTLVDSLAQQASDVTVWGFRLTDRDGTSAHKATPGTVPEGFGSVGTTDVGGSADLAGQEVKVEANVETGTRQLVEDEREGEGISKGEEGASVGEGEVKLVEEGVFVIGEKVTEVEEQASSVVVEVLSPVLGKEGAEEVVEGVEKVVVEAVEAAAGVVEERVAPLVEEAARQVEESAAMVGRVAEVVVEAGEKVESALGLAERVASVTEETAKEFPIVPVQEVERVEKVVEQAEAAVESITVTAKEVEGVAEEVRKEAEKVEEEATEVMESKEKRKEVVEEVVEFFEAKEHDVVEKQADATPPSTSPPQDKEARPEGQTEADISPAAPLTTPQVEPTQRREGLFDKLVTFFSQPSKGATDSAKEAEAATEGTTEVPDSAKVMGTAPETEAIGLAKEGEVVSESLSGFNISSSVGQESQIIDVLRPESILDKLQPAEAIAEDEGGTLEVSKATETTEYEINKESELEITEKLESKTTEKSGSENAEKTETETTGKPETNITQQLVTESLETPFKVIEEEKEQGVKESEVGDELQPPAREDQGTHVASREGEAEREEAGEGGEAEVLMSDTVTVARGKEGLFDQLVRMFRKDDEKVASSSATEPLQEPGSAGVVPVSGEGEEPASGTLAGEEEALTDAPRDVLGQADVSAGPVDTTQVTDVSAGPGNTVQVPDLQVPGNTAQAPEIIEVPEEAAQISVILKVPEDTLQVPDDTAQISDVLEVPEETARVPNAPLDLEKEVSAEPGAEEALPGEPLDTTLPQETDPAAVPAPSISEGVTSPAGTQDTQEVKTESTSLEESTSKSQTPPTVERIGLFDKLSSLFLKKEQQKESQPSEAPVADVEEALGEAEEPTVKVEEDTFTGAEQEAGPPAGEGGAAAVITPAPADLEEKDRSVTLMEEPSPETLRGSNAPAGMEAAESVDSVGGKEEEAASTAAVETTAAQPQGSGPQPEAETTQEGKDVVVQLSSPAPEKDYGQGSTEDSDMYTTRG